MDTWRRWLCLVTLALGALCAGAAHAQLAALPPLSAHVTDQAAMLAPGQRAQLEAQLADYEQKTGSQIALLLVKSTAPEQIEQYSIRVADAWKLGRKGVDDGVLLLVASDNPPALRRLRIEAGRGVQGVLTDAQSKRILQDVIAPRFVQHQYYEGLAAGIGAIAHLLDAEQFPPAPGTAGAQRVPERAGFLLPLILFGIFVLGAVLRPRGARLSRGGWGGGATGFILGAALGSLNRGGGGGGFGGGGGGGGGGFSGGGGGFDGGGASGNW